LSVERLSGVPGVDFDLRDVRGEFPPELEIVPLDRPPDANVRVPGSKSLTNRVLLVAALAEGRSRVHNPLFSDDSFHLMRALVELGFDVRADGNATVEIVGHAGHIPRSDVDLFVGNAGTVARFLPPALALGGGPYRVDGEPRMRERPVRELIEAMRALGAEVTYTSQDGHFPLEVVGGGIPGGAATVSGAKSSQFLSGLLLAAPYAHEPVTLNVLGDLVSRPYVNLTLEVMKAFDAKPSVLGLSTFRIDGGRYLAREYSVEPDASAASYFMAAAAVTGGRVTIEGLGTASSQGDLQFAEVLREMGCHVDLNQHHVEVHGPERLRGVTVDMNDFSDTMMSLAAIAPFATTPTHITGIAHTRLQETDRVFAVATELANLGVPVTETYDSLHIIPQGSEAGSAVRPALVRTYGDHRMAMAFAVTGLAAPGVRISDPVCVTKTFPRFFQRLEELR
jgi:3-phosphoshikimate 1-carboxyvinyltransferase